MFKNDGRKVRDGEMTITSATMTVLTGKDVEDDVKDMVDSSD